MTPLPDLGVPLWVAPPVLAAALIAAWTDQRTRRVPNRLTVPLAALGLAAHLVAGGAAGFSGALLGMAVAGAILLPGWLSGWTGGGDVKLVAAIGAWLGFPHGPLAALAALIAGGVIAAAVAARRRMLVRSLWGAALLGTWVLARAGGEPPVALSNQRFPFAGAVLAGTLVTLWVRA